MKARFASPYWTSPLTDNATLFDSIETINIPERYRVSRRAGGHG
jgi:hypothetical protein